MNTRYVVLMLALLTSACAPWSRVEPDNRAFEKRGDYTLEQPAGWVRRTADVNDLFLTRDGPALNLIVITRQPHDRKLPRTKRETRPDMLPVELAELALAEWRSHDTTALLDVVANTPTLLDGLPAARIHIRYLNERGLPIERIMVARADARGRLSLLYEAPAIVYFERGLPAFESVLSSLRFVRPAP